MMDTPADGLRRALGGAGSTVVVHTDLTRVPVIAGGREEVLAAHFDAIMEAAGDRVVLFPTYNYGFLRSGYFDPTNDSAETGVLNEWVRAHALSTIIHPVFRFSVTGAPWAMLANRWSAMHTAFGPGSELWKFTRAPEVTILSYGAPLRACSNIHVAEEEAQVSYREHREFRGTVEGVGPVTLDYFARKDGVEYDWRAVEELLDPLFQPRGAAIRAARATEVHRTLVAALREDEYAFVQTAEAAA